MVTTAIRVYGKGGGPVKGVAAIGDYIGATFRAFVDAVIPPAHLAGGVWAVSADAGAEEHGIYEYVIWQLDHSVELCSSAYPSNIRFSEATAILLDIGASRLIRTRQNVDPLTPGIFPGGGSFTLLTRTDRLRAVELLERVEIPLHLPPPPYRNNPAFIQVMMDSINQLAIFGFYSGWYGYGTTRLLQADRRHFQFVPPIWVGIGYPGPSFGYRDLRGYSGTFPRRPKHG